MVSERPEKPTLSFSTYSTYDECQRKWLLRSANDHLPRHLMWPAKQQSRLSPWQTFAGNVVDCALVDALFHFQDHGSWMTDLSKHGTGLASEGWRFSQDWASKVASRKPWPRSERFKPLDCHYYRQTPSREETGAIRDSILHCLANFVASSVPDELTAYGRDAWHGLRRPEEWMPWYRLKGVPIWASLDLAIRTSTVTYIIDWKAGKRNPWSEARVHQQLLWYALYAARAWEVPLEQIRVMAVWLQQTPEWTPHPVDADELDDLADRIQIRHRVLLAQLNSLRDGHLHLDDWPMTDRIQQCSGCQFRGVCEGARRTPTDGIPSVLDREWYDD